METLHGLEFVIVIMTPVANVAVIAGRVVVIAYWIVAVGNLYPINLLPADAAVHLPLLADEIAIARAWAFEVTFGPVFDPECNVPFLYSLSVWAIPGTGSFYHEWKVLERN